MTKHVLIVGGGVIGVCVAYYAMQKGYRVTLIERGGPDHDGCSLGNAGMIVPSHFVPLAAPGMVSYGLRTLWNPESPFAIRPRFNRDLIEWGWHFTRAANAAHVERSSPLLRDLSIASRTAYESLAGTFGNGFELVQRGLLMLCKTEQALAHEGHLAEMANRLGVLAEVVDKEAAAKIDPGVQMDVAGAVYFPQDCHLSPEKLMASLSGAILVGGGEILWETELQAWRTRGQRIEAVLSNKGEHVADEYVLAAGSWSPTLLRELGLRLPMQAGKGYSVTLPNPRHKPELCSILTEARVAVTPMGNTLRFGGTMEVSGLDESIQPRRVQGILKAIPHYFPQFCSNDFRDLPVWCGLRPCSPDGLPYIGRFNRWNNLSCATGHSMMGVSLAPITGRIIAGLLNGEAAEYAALSPDRYAP